MNKENIKKVLLAHQYPEKQAVSVAQELMQIDGCLSPALNSWMSNGSEQDYMAEGFSLLELKNKFCMTYPAALLTIDWLLKEPEMATEAINHGIK